MDKKHWNGFWIFCILAAATGCARLMDTPKVIWGSSTRALEEARIDAVSKTYRCSYNDCFDAVLALQLDKKNAKPEVTENEDFIVEKPPKGYFDVFIKNRKKGHIVVVGIPGSVDTTEVGIFFSQPTLTSVKIEVSSLSTSAKLNVSERVFQELDLQFSEYK